MPMPPNKALELAGARETFEIGAARRRGVHGASAQRTGVSQREMIRIALIVGMLHLAAVQAGADDFTGAWKVVEVRETQTDGYPWSAEIKYPRDMTLELRDGRLIGNYTDQTGYSDDFELAAVVNQGRDLLLVHGGAATKDPNSLSPIHHVKLVGGKLRAVVTAHDKLFEWVAERRQ